MVEFFPLLSDDSDLSEIKQNYQDVLALFTEGKLKDEGDVWEAVNRLMYLEPDTWKSYLEYDPKMWSCNVYGHACPVFVCQSGATETKEARRETRNIPVDIMLQVVRRDNQACQICGQLVSDKETQFDHIIPFSKGGPTTVANLRLVHAICNQKRSNKTEDFLSA